MEDRMLSDEILLALIKKAGGDVSKVEAEVAAIKDGTNIDSFSDVESALADKTDDDAVAPEFNDTTAYRTGELVYKDGTLYKFDSDHAAGAWDSSEVSPTTVAAEFNQLKNTLSDIFPSDYAFDINTNYNTKQSVVLSVIGDYLIADITFSTKENPDKSIGGLFYNNTAITFSSEKYGSAIGYDTPNLLYAIRTNGMIEFFNVPEANKWYNIKLFVKVK